MFRPVALRLFVTLLGLAPEPPHFEAMFFGAVQSPFTVEHAIVVNPRRTSDASTNCRNGVIVMIVTGDMRMFRRFVKDVPGARCVAKNLFKSFGDRNEWPWNGSGFGESLRCFWEWCHFS